jgi:hypothetical protein
LEIRRLGVSEEAIIKILQVSSTPKLPEAKAIKRSQKEGFMP